MSFRDMTVGCVQASTSGQPSAPAPDRDDQPLSVRLREISVAKRRLRESKAAAATKKAVQAVQARARVVSITWHTYPIVYSASEEENSRKAFSYGDVPQLWEPRDRDLLIFYGVGFSEVKWCGWFYSPGIGDYSTGEYEHLSDLIDAYGPGTNVYASHGTTDDYGDSVPNTGHMFICSPTKWGAADMANERIAIAKRFPRLVLYVPQLFKESHAGVRPPLSQRPDLR